MTKQEKEYLNRILKGLKEMDNSYSKEKLNISKIPKPFRYWPAEIETAVGLLEQFIK